MQVERPTQKQIAQAAGVSRTTVSFVLNDVPDVNISSETRQRVLEAAAQLNYYPDAAALRLASGRTHTLAVVLHQGPTQTYSDAFLPQMLQGVSQAARQKGYYVLFYPIGPNQDRASYVELVRGRHADGLILSGPRSDDTHLLKLHREGYPIVLQGQLPGSDVPFVDVDNVKGASLAVEHLIELGHQRIGMITNAPLTYTSARQRLDGYQQALEQHGISFEPSRVRYAHFDEESGERTVNELLDAEPGLTAIFAASDTVCYGVLRAARHRGLQVPADLAVVGFDDIPTSRYVFPSLTTLRLPAFGLGWAVADLLIRLIDRQEIEETQVILDTELVIRRSCGALDRQGV
jgi:DNA-binding LacI/PurR family transcriptional regulator